VSLIRLVQVKKQGQNSPFLLFMHYITSLLLCSLLKFDFPHHDQI
jgi:hypothetical protein